VKPDFAPVSAAIDRVASALHKGAWDYVGAVAIVITLLVIIKYTYETFLLRVAAQRQNELSVMPVMAIVAQCSSGPDRRAVVLRSVGTGPAFNVSIDHVRVGDGELSMEYGDDVMMAGHIVKVRFHFQAGNSDTGLGLDELYEWINTGRLPNPLHLVVRCRALNSVDYAFTFRGRPEAGRLKITFEGVVRS
jgi:hypothetical protein